MKKLLAFSIALLILSGSLYSVIASDYYCDIPWYYRAYCNYSGCCSDNFYCGMFRRQLSGPGSCQMRYLGDNFVILEDVSCTSASQGCPSGAGHGDRRDRTPDAP
jgi:hypothetical protein